MAAGDAEPFVAVLGVDARDCEAKVASWGELDPKFDKSKYSDILAYSDSVGSSEVL